MSSMARAYPLGFLAIIALIAGGVFVLDITFPLGMTACVFYIAIVLAGMWHPRRHFVFTLAATGSILAILGYFFAAPREISWMIVPDRGTPILIMWVTAALCYRRKGWEAELETRIQKRTRELIDEIDKREAMEKNGHENEVLANFPEDNPNPLLMFAQNGRLSYANKSSTPLLEHFKFGLGQPAPEEWRRIFTGLLQPGRVSNASESYMECVCGASAFSLLFMRTQAPGGVKIYGRNITRRKQAEAETLATKERYQDLYENAPSAYCSIDHTSGAIIHYNAAFVSLFRCERDEPTCMTLFDLYANPPDDRLKADELSLFFNEKLEADGIERQMRRRNGETIWVNFSIKLKKNADGSVAKSRFIITDITKLLQTQHDLIEQKLHLSNYAEELKANTKSLEQAFGELTAQRDKILAADLAKSQFLATMSHELRTPLNAIMGFSAMMIQQMAGPLGSPLYVEYAGNVYRSGAHLLSLIETVLEMSKIDAGRYRLRRKAFILADLISEVFMTVKDRADEDEISLVNKTSTELPLLFADRNAIKQILINLIVNAVKFSHNGGSVVVTATASTPRFCITVSDTGVGIAKENIQTAMQPFSQIERHNHKVQEGVGLGLPLCKALAELHQGTLHIDSDLGKGAAVTITLPVSVQTPWRPSMSTGIAVLDSDHRVLMAVIDRLAASLWVGDGSCVIEDLIETLSIFAEIHLGIEETLMNALQYPETEKHKTCHQQFRAWLDALKENHDGLKSDDEITKINNYLGNWLIDHIMTIDKAYNEFFNHKTKDVSACLVNYVGVMETLNRMDAKPQNDQHPT